MTRITAVCIYDDLAACQTRIPVRPTDHETACRVDKELRVGVDQLLRQYRIEYIFPDVLVDLLLCHIRIMLGG